MKANGAALPWFLLTGAPRSGTTALGVALTADPATAYIHEPFNPYCGTIALGSSEPPPPSSPNDLQRLETVVRGLKTFYIDTARSRFVNDTELTYLRRRLLGGRTDHSLRKARWARHLEAVVVKDPVGAFLTEALVKQFGWQATAIVRNPEDVVRSMQRLGWHPRVAAERGVDALRIADFPSSIVEPLARGLESDDPVALQTIRWCAVNHWLRRLAEAHTIDVVTFHAFRRSPVDVVRHVRTAWELPPVADGAIDADRRRRQLANRFLGPFGSAIGQLEEPGVRNASDSLAAADRATIAELASPLRPWLQEIGEPW